MLRESANKAGRVCVLFLAQRRVTQGFCFCLLVETGFHGL